MDSSDLQQGEEFISFQHIMRDNTCTAIVSKPAAIRIIGNNDNPSLIVRPLI